MERFEVGNLVVRRAHGNPDVLLILELNGEQARCCLEQMHTMVEWIPLTDLIRAPGSSGSERGM